MVKTLLSTFRICFVNFFDIFWYLLWCSFAKFRFFASQVWIFAFLRNFAKFRVKICFSIFIIIKCGFYMFCEIFRDFQWFLSSYGRNIFLYPPIMGHGKWKNLPMLHEITLCWNSSYLFWTAVILFFHSNHSKPQYTASW